MMTMVLRLLSLLSFRSIFLTVLIAGVVVLFLTQDYVVVNGGVGVGRKAVKPKKHPTYSKISNEPNNNNTDDQYLIPSALQRDILFCESNNYVADRNGGDILQQVPSNTSRKPFSLQLQNFRHKTSGQRGICSSLDELLLAIRNGHREWDDSILSDDITSTITVSSLTKNESGARLEQYPSRFVPYGCDIPLLLNDRDNDDGENQDDDNEEASSLVSDTTMCQIMSLFPNGVLLLGDSLLRHVLLGLLSGLLNDVRHGWSQFSWDRTMQEKCTCDGQYSEHEICRRYTDLMLQDINSVVRNAKNWSLCDRGGRGSTHNPPFPPLYFHTYAYSEGPTLFNWFRGINCDTEDGALLLVLGGGLHFKVDAKTTFYFFDRIFNHPVIQQCARKRQLYIIWSSLNTVTSVDVLREHPHQGPDPTKQFNQNITDLFYKKYNMTNVSIVDWMNLTNGAQTSDGVHHLTDVNYFKAQYLLLIAKGMYQEQRYTTTLLNPL